MFDVTELLKKINTNIETSTNTYIYYDKATGALSKIANTCDEESEDSVLESSYEEVNNIIDGTHRLEEYRVQFDSTTSSYKLFKKTELTKLNSINEKLHKLDTKFDEDDVDIIVTQDNSTQTWKIRVTDSGAVKLKQNIIHITDRISFTIVQNNDPNIFYEKFDVDISIFKTTNIFETKFKYDYSKLLTPPSIYTYKLFSKYGHKVNS
jgi:hypothetical protein